jgi:pimeloyl-ACP methyl ester carboxylesterase
MSVLYIVRQSTLRLLRVSLIGLPLSYLAVAGALYFYQERLVYKPLRTLHGDPLSKGLAYDDLRLATPDGELLHAWYIPAHAAHGTVLYLHGNGGNISSILPDVLVLHELGLNLLLLDYRGYGESSGSPSEQGMYTDVQTAWDYLTATRGIAATQIVIVGYSMGGGVAAWLAERTAPAGLILINTFTSMKDRGSELYPYLPVRQLMRYHYPILERLPQITSPILIAHARDDRTIPIEHGYRLHAAAASPFPVLETDGGHGAGIAAVARLYPHELQAFLVTVLQQPDPLQSGSPMGD